MIINHLLEFICAYQLFTQHVVLDGGGEPQFIHAWSVT